MCTVSVSTCKGIFPCGCLQALKTEAQQTELPPESWLQEQLLVPLGSSKMSFVPAGPTPPHCCNLGLWIRKREGNVWVSQPERDWNALRKWVTNLAANLQMLVQLGVRVHWFLTRLWSVPENTGIKNAAELLKIGRWDPVLGDSALKFCLHTGILAEQTENVSHRPQLWKVFLF